jgi:predicted phage-related endonuclease
MFTPEQRAGFLGASDMPYLMGNKTPEQLLAWWETKVGLREPDPPTYAMRLGSLVGDFIIAEYERQSGVAITRRQDVVPSSVNKRFRSTLDGFDAHRNAVIEAKFASPFFDRDQIFQTYYPQVAMQMHCTNADGGFLVVAQGTNEPYEIECVRDSDYERRLLERAATMLECMDTMTPPVTIDQPKIVAPEKWRTVDLDIDTYLNWVEPLRDVLQIYSDTKQAADTNENAGKTAKRLIPDDVGRVLSAAYIIARNKNGALAITRRKT